VPLQWRGFVPRPDKVSTPLHEAVAPRPADSCWRCSSRPCSASSTYKTQGVDFGASCVSNEHLRQLKLIDASGTRRSCARAANCSGERGTDLAVP